MTDLEKAKGILKGKNQALVIVKDGRTIFQSASSGINSLLQAVDKLGGQLSGASVADRVVGKAAALLLAFSRVACVYAATLSRKGLRTLRRHEISVEYDLSLIHI